jgi:hypothetical protein
VRDFISVVAFLVRNSSRRVAFHVIVWRDNLKKCEVFSVDGGVRKDVLGFRFFSGERSNEVIIIETRS